jgi:acyl transferase domain-containing protein/3-hydroxymyristoyl/3-hydroxydecanoyl-(acyl carrier protein) dehydratase
VFPSAPDVAAFWTNILAGYDASREVPAERWPSSPEWFAKNGIGADGVASLKVCLLDGIPAPRSAHDGLDDLSRLSLAAAEMTLDDARGQLPDRSRVATILASIALPTAESSRLSEEVFLETLAQSLTPRPQAPPPAVDPVWRQVTGRPAEAVANALGLGGFTLTLDAACASSLYAVKLACDALTDGRADAVLAGGANRADSLYTQAGFTALGALSPSGRCSPFDHKGDGLVVGEGAGFLLLKRLEDATAQGDRVYAVIRGIGLSNDVGGSLLAPDSEGQLRALRQAYGQAGWSPKQVGLVECHGTGTPMGDKTEFNSLRQFWQQQVADESGQGTVLGSVKSQIGHLLTGAGAAGLIKVIKAIQSRTLPPMNNFESPSKGITFQGTPFRVLGRPEPWKGQGPLRAGVSAFGFGGINGHVLLEEPGQPAVAAESSWPGPLEEVVITAVALKIGQDLDFSTFTRDRLLGQSASAPRPEGRWPASGGELASLDHVWGAYLQALSVEAGEFRVPPKDLPEILLQQSLLLAVAHQATEQSSLGPKERCRRSGALIGISLDLETTNFHLRWALPRMLERLGLSPEELDSEAVSALREALSRPLDSTRTLGALGSIAASRAAREFSLGGPSYAISCGELSGVRALEIGVRAIQNGEMESCLIGAIDLAGDPRTVWSEDRLKAYIRGGPARPFDQQGQGPTVAEGAVAMVIKSRAAAEADGDRILALVDSVLAAAGPHALARTLEALAQQVAGRPPGFVDVMSRGHADEDSEFLNLYSQRLGQPVEPTVRPTAFGTVAGSVGQAGAMAGLLSVISAASALDSKVIPAVVGMREPLPSPPGTYLPRESAFWWHDGQVGPRTAVSVGLSAGGDSHAVILREGTSKGEFGGSLTRARALPGQLFLLAVSRIGALREQAHSSTDLEHLASRWWQAGEHAQSGPRGGLVARDLGELRKGLDLLERCVKGEQPPMDGQAGVFYQPDPTGGETAWVFPGSGNHYLGMGRELALLFPEIAAEVNAEAGASYQHFTPWLTQPFSGDRRSGWQAQALAAIEADPLAPIFSQVTFAILASRVLGLFLAQPQAAIGYSLGETAALFSLGAWTARDQMFQRTVASPLFRSQLRGDYETPRSVLGLPAESPFVWRVAVVNRPEHEVRNAIQAAARRDVFLLIVNTPQECVIGGHHESVEEIVHQLGCDVFFLDGVPTVHCALMHPVAEAYRDLHRLPTTPPQGVRFYNGHRHQAYAPDTESAANSITENAQYGFSFPEVIRAAYQDGVRHFVEIGPGGSCARMIRTILEGETAWTRSLSLPKVGEAMALLRLLASAHVHGAAVNLGALYSRSGADSGKPSARPKIVVKAGANLARRLDPPLARKPLSPKGPEANGRSLETPLLIAAPPLITRPPQALPQAAPAPVASEPGATTPRGRHPSRALVWTSPQTSQPTTLTKDGQTMTSRIPTPSQDLTPVIGLHPDYHGDPGARLAASIVESTRQTAMAHESYLELMEKTRLQMESLLSGVMTSPVLASQAPVHVQSVDRDPWAKLDPASNNPLMRGERPRDAQAWLNRDMCMEFAIGSIEKVLGSKFASVDQRLVRVRLPDEPLMLCDRIMGVEGEPGALCSGKEGSLPAKTGGRLITEHDVFPEAWYLDHDRAPVCISVEAGQADLFLASYLGIDLVTNSDRAYRLLDATISFQRGLPQPGETIVYDIRIERFVRQGDVYLFFFEFDGTIDGQPLITMRKGCAGFHTAAEIEASGGIVLTKRERQPMPGKAPAGWHPPAPFPRGLAAVESYSDAQIEAFRRKDLQGCFGPNFEGLPLHRPYGLPEGRMKLFDRVTHLQADGGRFGLGRIEAEADIRPDDWFLTCHFTDDMVMPGTLMYECCAHTLRFLLARLGWLAEEAAVAFEPRLNTPAALKCRGPVTVKTKKVLYQVDIKEIGFGPEPYVLADALMFGDGKQIVRFEDMSMQLTGLTAAHIDAVWAGQRHGSQPGAAMPSPSRASTATPAPSLAAPAIYDKESIMQFSNGRPSLAFGPEYAVFDNERRIARLPGPPYQFMDRVVEVNQPKFVLQAGDWIEAHYDVPPDEWYFAANRQDSMAYCILLEAALQPCGWLAAYVGSALRSSTDVKFRNLGGTGTLWKEFFPGVGTVRMRVKMTEVSEAGGMIIENFAMQMWVGDDLYYEGTTYFGFFSAAALAKQLGVRDAAQRTYTPTPEELAGARPSPFGIFHPLDPDDRRLDAGPGACLPAKALLMMDQVDLYLPNSGLQGLGFIQGSKIVDPDEWFFKAHFYQDPVWPGSLGLEAFLQLVKYAALKTWPELVDTHRFEPIAVGLPHTWAYRGQVIPTNKKVVVDVSITRREDGPAPLLLGQGFLRVDGIPIYEMTDFGLRMVPQ